MTHSLVFLFQPFYRRATPLFLILFQYSRSHTATVGVMIMRNVVRIAAVLIAAFEISAGFSNLAAKASTDSSANILLGNVIQSHFNHCLADVPINLYLLSIPILQFSIRIENKSAVRPDLTGFQWYRYHRDFLRHLICFLTIFSTSDDAIHN